MPYSLNYSRISRSISFGMLALGLVSLCPMPLTAQDSNSTSPPQLHVDCVGVTRLPGTTHDKSGLTGTLETGTPYDAFGGISAIDYLASEDIFVALSDRGPADGASSFPCRYHELKLRFDLDKKDIQVELLETHMLVTENGKSLTGSLAVLGKWNGNGPTPVLDPEGIRVSPRNEILISDEYGPSVAIFSRTGQRLRSYALPAHLKLTDFIKPTKTMGTFPNRGLEGVTYSQNRRFIIAASQGPLVQDGRIEGNKCLGKWVRFIVIHETGEVGEWLYQLDDESTGISEILAFDEHRYLVLERDSLIGKAAKYKRVHLIDSRGASNIVAIDSLNAVDTARLKPLRKLGYIDLQVPEFNLAGDNTPEKPEDSRGANLSRMDDDC